MIKSIFKIVVIDDHPIVTQGIVELLGRHQHTEIVGVGGCTAEALELAAAKTPDIMLLDLKMPGGGIPGLRKIRAKFPKIKCIVLTADDCANTAIEAMNAGARGYVLKGVTASGLIGAINTVCSNESFISPEFAHKLLETVQAHGDTGTSNKSSLSFRETQILDAVEKGLTNRQVGERLNISEKTVKHYMSSLMQKLGVPNRVAAVIAHQKTRPPIGIAAI